MRKIRSSTKIGIGFVLTLAIFWFAFNRIQDMIIMGQHFAPISPTKINIVGITPSGYKVITSNEVTQLVETQGDFSSDQSGPEGSDNDSDGAVKKKISVKDMLGVLAGDSKALGSFVMAMNDLNENDLPPIRVTWNKPDMTKALAGDPVLSKKLENDLNMKLDGSPLPYLNVHSLENGIVCDVPVTVTVTLNGQPTKVTGDVLIPYKPKMVKAVETLVAGDPGKIDNNVITGYYKQEAEKLLNDGKNKENIKQTLTEQYSDETAAKYIEFPERLLSTAFIVVNDSYIDDANYSTYNANNGKPLYDLHIQLNDEGRRRLWQYSRRRVGDQILLTSNGVAIADARISHPLMSGAVTITQMKNQDLLDDLIANLKSVKADKVAAK